MMQGASIENLRYAQAVARTGSFSAAAREYGVTQPALSNGIARLESSLGDRLFDRSPRGVTPTAFGTQILPTIDSAIAALEAVASQAERLRARDDQPLRVGVSPLIGADLVARAFTAARTLTPPRALVLREANMEVLRQELASGELELIMIPSVSPIEQFEQRVFHREPVVVVEPATTAPDSADPVELGETAAHPFILVPDQCGLTAFTTQLFHDNGITLNTYPGEAASYRVLEEWTKLSLGAALLPASKAASARARPLHHNGDSVEISYEVAWRNDGSPLHNAISRLTDGLLAEA